MSQKQVMPKSEDLSRSLEINSIWTFDTEFPTIFNKSCTYITFKSAVKHRQLGYGYPRGQTVHKPKSNTGMSQKQVMPKSEDLSRSLEINSIWTFDTEFPTIFNKSCTYITFKSAVKHRQLGYGYPRGQTVHLAEATTQDTYSSI